MPQNIHPDPNVPPFDGGACRGDRGGALQTGEGRTSQSLRRGRPSQDKTASAFSTWDYPSKKLCSIGANQESEQASLDEFDPNSANIGSSSFLPSKQLTPQSTDPMDMLMLGIDDMPSPEDSSKAQQLDFSDHEGIHLIQLAYTGDPDYAFLDDTNAAQGSEGAHRVRSSDHLIPPPPQGPTPPPLLSSSAKTKVASRPFILSATTTSSSFEGSGSPGKQPLAVLRQQTKTKTVVTGQIRESSSSKVVAKQPPPNGILHPFHGGVLTPREAGARIVKKALPKRVTRGRVKQEALEEKTILQASQTRSDSSISVTTAKVPPAPDSKKAFDHGMAGVQITTPFLNRYWRNDRKFLQCFPYCPEYGDYLTVKQEKLTHKNASLCQAEIRTSIRISEPLRREINKSGFVEKPKPNQVKAEGPCQFRSSESTDRTAWINSFLEDGGIAVIGRFVKVDPFEAEPFAPFKRRYTKSEMASLLDIDGELGWAFVAEPSTCNKDGTQWEYSMYPRTWNFPLTLSKARKAINATRDLFCFEVMVWTALESHQWSKYQQAHLPVPHKGFTKSKRKADSHLQYGCIASSRSKGFEIASTRTLLRQTVDQKRRVASSSSTKGTASRSSSSI